MKQQYLMTALFLAGFSFGTTPLSVHASNVVVPRDPVQKRILQKKLKLEEMYREMEHQQWHAKKMSEMEQNSEEKMWEKIQEKILKTQADQNRKEEFETALSKCLAGTKEDKLLKLLGNKSWQIRERATEELIKVAEPNAEIRKKLEAATANEDPEIRMRARRIVEEAELAPVRRKIVSYVKSVASASKLIDFGDGAAEFVVGSRFIPTDIPYEPFIKVLTEMKKLNSQDRQLSERERDIMHFTINELLWKVRDLQERSERDK